MSDTIQEAREARAKLESRRHVTETGCWEWTGSLFPTGYGQVWFSGSNKRAHRLAYVAYVGAIPDDKVVCHRCDRKCFNPDHLFVGTRLENNLDMWTKKRGRNGESSKTHCKWGHPYEDSNMFVYNRGDGKQQRVCRECNRQNKRKQYHRNKENA